MDIADAFRDDFQHLRNQYTEILGPTESPENDKSPEILPNGLEFVHRNHWGAFPTQAVEGIEPLKIPISKVRLTHTGATSCTDLRTCKIRVARIQMNHMYHHGLQDIAFKQKELTFRSFLIGPDGRVYEGRGWELQPERDEKLHRIGDDCLEVAFLGRYKWDPPPPLMLRTCQSFLKLGVEMEFLNSNYELITRYAHLGGSGEDVVEEITLEEIMAAERRRADERRAIENPRMPVEYYCHFT